MRFRRGRERRSAWLGVVFLATIGSACHGSKPVAVREPAEPSAVLARIGSQAIGTEALSPAAQARLTELDLERWALVRGEVDRVVNERVTQLAAKTAGLSEADLLRRELATRAPDPTDAEVAEALGKPPYAALLDRMLAAGAPAGAPTAASPGAIEPVSVVVDGPAAAALQAKREGAIRAQLSGRVKELLRQDRTSAARGELMRDWRSQFGVTIDVPVPHVASLHVPEEGFVTRADDRAPSGQALAGQGLSGRGPSGQGPSGRAASAPLATVELVLDGRSVSRHKLHVARLEWRPWR